MNSNCGEVCCGGEELTPSVCCMKLSILPIARGGGEVSCVCVLGGSINGFPRGGCVIVMPIG